MSGGGGGGNLGGGSSSSSSTVSKCPPGVFCIENIALFLVISLVVIVLGFFGMRTISSNAGTAAVEPQHKQWLSLPSISMNNDSMNDQPPTSSSELSNLYNPLQPPLKNLSTVTGIGSQTIDVRGPVMPINIRTQGVDAPYGQVGLLTRANGKETMLSLFGRPLMANRNKFQYYTISEKNPTLKLPISQIGKSCTSEYGCNELYTGDTVFVEGYNDAFNVTIYENSNFRYIPTI